MESLTLPSGRRIGKGAPVFIIAEVGSNWSSLENARMSIRAAKNSGADAVKFQLYNHYDLYGVAGSMPGELPEAWLPRLKQEADEQRIEFMCSAFSPSGIAAVNPFVNIHKLASAELTHRRMLETLLALRKPAIVSTGASGRYDIQLALEALESLPTVILYCVSAYPAPLIDLRNIRALHKQFNRPVGFSDHSQDVMELCQVAVQREGACILEKHVNFAGAESSDSGHSLNERDFRYYVNAARGDEIPLQTITPHENPMVKQHNRRLIATDVIIPGDTLKEGQNFGIYRSLCEEDGAIHPFMIDEVNGKTAKVRIERGNGIRPGDL